jgi:cell wall-associated NlpC family hydrolase
VTTTMLHRGSSGAGVVRLQQELARAGFNPHGFDGKFGAKTEAALRAFQRARHIVVDGRVGSQTWHALDVFQHAPASSKPKVAQAGPTPGASPKVGSMLSWAKTQIGTPYAAVNPFRFGNVPWDGKAHRSVNGSSTVWKYPKGTKVYDCSGFVVAAYRKLGVDLAAHGLASSGAMAADHRFLQSVPKSQLRPGDLITYSAHNGVGHVVIYLGNGQCISATGGRGVCVTPVDWGRANAFKRVPVG